MRYLLGVVLSIFLVSLCHAKIVTVTSHTAELQNEPSAYATQVLLKAPRYYPLSVQEEENGYYKVRDYRGRSGWVKKSEVGTNPKGVVVEVKRVNVRQGPGTDHPVVFKAYQGVTFKVLDRKKDWLYIQHESGKKGWVFRSLTWGQ